MQLFHLVNQYQETGDVPKLMADAYEMLRYYPGFGKSAMAFEATRVMLLPPLEGDDVRRQWGYRVVEARESLEMMGIHPVEDKYQFAHFPHGYTEGDVVLVYGWRGRALTVSVGVYDDRVVTAIEGEDTCHAMSVPFVVLVKAVLVLAMGTVRESGHE